MSWNDAMGLISTVALSLPILTIIAVGLAGYRTFPALLIYYSIIVGYNLFTEGYIKSGDDFTRYYGVLNNLLDAPLMLTFLTYFSTSPEFKKRMQILTGVFVAFEITVLATFGFSIQTITIILGPGIFLVLAFALPFFVRQTKITITHHKGTGKALIAASLLFAYGCYSIIYIMYYLLKTRDVQNTFLVYYFATTISSIPMCAGIVIERRRVKKTFRTHGRAQGTIPALRA